MLLQIFTFRSEQTFEERLIKMSRFMSADVLKELIIGIKQEELLINMLAILKCVYESKRSTKLAETDSDNVSLKRKVAKVSEYKILHYSLDMVFILILD